MPTSVSVHEKKTTYVKKTFDFIDIYLFWLDLYKIWTFFQVSGKKVSFALLVGSELPKC